MLSVQIPLAAHVDVTLSKHITEELQGRIQEGVGLTPPLRFPSPPPKSDISPSLMLYSYTGYKFSVLPSLPRSLQQQERPTARFSAGQCCLREIKPEGATGSGSWQ